MKSSQKMFCTILRSGITAPTRLLSDGTPARASAALMESSYFKRCRAPEHWPTGRADDPLTHFEGPWQLAPSSMATAVSSPAHKSDVSKQETRPRTTEKFRRMALGFTGSSE